MNGIPLFSTLALALRDLIGHESEIVTTQPCSGGCIAQAEIITLRDGGRIFLKSTDGPAAMLVAETYGLKLLASTQTVHVPEVLGAFVVAANTDQGAHRTYLAMQAIDAKRPTTASWEMLGQQLAGLHRHDGGRRFGLDVDNFIGATPQPNSPHENWCQFFATQRLGFQCSLLRNAYPQLVKLVERLIDKLPMLIPPQPECSLLHGDLWNGNFLADRDGQPIVIDPAVYYGDREAELAMPVLFGGFPPAFWSNYEATWALEAGWQGRVEIYKLYHLLNHVTLFGSSYLAACMSIAKRFVG